MTDGHKHRTLRLDPSTRVGGALYAALRKPRFHTTDEQRASDSPYPYGLCREHCTTTCWYLSALSILHRWTGLTLWLERRNPADE